MALNKKLTMAVSVIALAASGPLSAQPFPQPSAQEPSGFDPLASQPWASQGLASEPGTWDADQALGSDMMGADMGGLDTGMDPATIPDQGGADFFDAQPAPQPTQDTMDRTQGMPMPDSAATPAGAAQSPWGSAAPQAEPGADALGMDNTALDAPQDAPAFPQDLNAPDQAADAPGAAADIFAAPAQDPTQDTGQDWSAQSGDTDPLAVPQDAPASAFNAPDAGFETGAADPIFVPDQDQALPPSTDTDLGAPGLADSIPPMEDTPAPQSAPAATPVDENPTSAPVSDLNTDPQAGLADDLPADSLPQADLPMESAPDMSQEDMGDTPADQGAGLAQDGQNAGAQPQPLETPQQTEAPSAAPAPATQPDSAALGQAAGAEPLPAPDADDAVPTQSGIVIAPTQEAIQPQPAPAAQAPADAPAAIPQEVQEAVQADPAVQQSVQVLENTADTPLAATQQEPAAAPIVRTIEDSRSADEEFSGTLSASPALSAQDSRESERRREREARRDRLEAAGLGAIAGLAVGAIINSRQGPDQTAVATQEVVATAPERIVVLDRSTNIYQVWRDDDSILRQPGMREETTVYPDGSVRTVLYADNGTQVRTIRDARGRVLRRERIVGDQRIVILDDLQPVPNVDVRQLPAPRIPRLYVPQTVDPVLGAQIVRSSSTQVNRTFSLGQIRNIWEVRRLVPVLDTDPVLFATGSSALTGQQAAALSGLAAVMLELLRTNPGEIFLVEGHTDAVGSAASNLALSDRRAETVAQALVDYFGIPASNLVFQGYGESLLAVNTTAAEPRNRRVEIRRITPLLQGASQ